VNSPRSKIGGNLVTEKRKNQTRKSGRCEKRKEFPIEIGHYWVNVKRCVGWVRDINIVNKAAISNYQKKKSKKRRVTLEGVGSEGYNRKKQKTVSIALEEANQARTEIDTKRTMKDGFMTISDQKNKHTGSLKGLSGGSVWGGTKKRERRVTVFGPMFRYLGGKIFVRHRDPGKTSVCE